MLVDRPQIWWTMWYNILKFGSVYTVLLWSPGPRIHIEPLGTYAHSPSPPPPPISGKGYPRITLLSRVLVTVGNYKNTLFSCFFPGNLPETTAKRYPFFQRKWERACGPLMNSSGGPAGLWSLEAGCAAPRFRLDNGQTGGGRQRIVRKHLLPLNFIVRSNHRTLYCSVEIYGSNLAPHLTGIWKPISEVFFF